MLQLFQPGQHNLTVALLLSDSNHHLIQIVFYFGFSQPSNYIWPDRDVFPRSLPNQLCSSYWRFCFLSPPCLQDWKRLQCYLFSSFREAVRLLPSSSKIIFNVSRVGYEVKTNFVAMNFCGFSVSSLPSSILKISVSDPDAIVY